jgi:hypothetical protein
MYNTSQYYLNKGHPSLIGLKHWFKAMPGGLLKDIYGNLQITKVGSPDTNGPIRTGGIGVVNLPTTSDYFTVAETPRLRPENEFTISCWYRQNGSPSTYANIFDYQAKNGASSPYHSYKIGVNHGSAANVYSFEFGQAVGATRSMYAAQTPSTTKYDHIAWSWNISLQSGHVYINGVYAGDVSNAQYIYYDTPNTIFIGNGIIGQIDDIMVYNRYMGVTELKQLYRLGLSGFPGIIKRGKTAFCKQELVVSNFNSLLWTLIT